MDELSWADFILWLESRYPQRATPEDQRVTGLAVLRQPGALIMRVSMDSGPQMVSVPSASWQRFAVGETVVLSRTGVEVVGLKGRTAGSRGLLPEDEGGGFVPHLPPERESGQLPQPGHIPILNDQGEYADGGVQTEEQFGVYFGIVLDDGTVSVRGVQQIDHQERRTRAYAGVFSLSLDLRPNGREIADPPEYDLMLTTPEFMQELRDNSNPLPRYTFRSEGFLDYESRSTYQEDPGFTFSGMPIPVPAVTNSQSGRVALIIADDRLFPDRYPPASFYPPTQRARQPVPAVPEFTLRSPLVNGHSFRINSVVLGGSLNQQTVQVDDTVLAGQYDYFTAFQDAAGLTLVLQSRAAGTVTVIPGLDLSKSITVPEAVLLLDLGGQVGSDNALRLDIFTGHHSFPTDRGYAAIRPPDNSSSHFVSIGTWDAYRDVPADKWRVAGLSKPRTRKAFDAGQAATPPARLPPRPPHGLAALDVYGVRADSEALSVPVLWRSVRGEPVFRPPIQVETWDGTKWVISPSALAALSKPYQPGQQDDRTSVSGRLRLTLHVDGLLVFVGRARGDLSRLLVGGQPANANWLGLDAGHTPGWPASRPKGWHPFTFRATGGPLLELDTQGLKLSALNFRSVTGIR